MREPRAQHPCRQREKHYVTSWMLIQSQGLIMNQSVWQLLGYEDQSVVNQRKRNATQQLNIYGFHSILHICFNDNCRQRENSNNIGVKTYPKCPTSAFKCWLEQKYLSPNGPNNSNDQQGHIDIWRDEVTTKKVKIYNGNAKGDLWPRKA